MIALGVILAVIGYFTTRILLWIGVALILFGVLAALSGHTAY